MSSSHRIPHSLAVLVVLCALMLVRGPMISAQVPASHPGSVIIDRMRADLGARRYAAVIDGANEVLGTARTLSVEEQTLVWQMLAAAYYPPEPRAQRPDSAALPLEALVRVAPDAQLPDSFRWPGLDALLERVRGSVFAVAARPAAEYVISLDQPALVTVVATRPARFRLSVINPSTGVAVAHDSVAASRKALLRLRAHDGTRPLLTSGEHQLSITVTDRLTGDSTVLTYRATATASGPSQSAIVAVPAFVPPSRATLSPTRAGSIVLGGLAFAGATVAVASGARAREPIRSAFGRDERAYIVAGAIVVAAAWSLFAERDARAPDDARAVARARAAHDARVAAAIASARSTASRYRVVLRVEKQ